MALSAARSRRCDDLFTPGDFACSETSRALVTWQRASARRAHLLNRDMVAPVLVWGAAALGVVCLFAAIHA